MGPRKATRPGRTCCGGNEVRRAIRWKFTNKNEAGSSDQEKKWEITGQIYFPALLYCPWDIRLVQTLPSGVLLYAGKRAE